MADNRPGFRIVVGEKYNTANGEEKTAWTELGKGWSVKNGGISVKLRPGVALTGDFMVFPNTERPADDSQADE